MNRFEMPFVQGEIKYVQLDTVTCLGFLGSAFVSEEGGWPLIRGAPDDDVAIFTTLNSPLRGSVERTIELIRKATFTNCLWSG